MDRTLWLIVVCLNVNVNNIIKTYPLTNGIYNNKNKPHVTTKLFFFPVLSFV